MRTGSVDPSEADGPSGTVDGYTSALTVIAGERYMLYIDNFDISGQAFTLDWMLSNGASLDCSLLPIELIDLAATPLNQRVMVEWTTVSETGSASFIVERSRDGIDFSPIGSMAAAGESRTRIDYDFWDHEPIHGVNYYRIHQLDEDGSSTYSTVVSATIVTDTRLVLAPNPAHDRLDIRMNGTEDEVHLSLFDATGRMVRTWVERSATGQLTIPVSALDAGSYTIMAANASGELLGHASFMKR
jgi:hypothetical protein